MKHSSSRHQQLLTSFNTFKIDDNSVQNKQIKKNLLTVFILNSFKLSFSNCRAENLLSWKQI